MRTVRASMFRVLLLLPPVALLLAAIPRFQTGLAVDAVFPIPIYAVMNVRLPAETYRAAANILASANEADGVTHLQRAEIASLAGGAAPAVTGLLRDALARSPSSSRGWMLLAEQSRETDPKAAAAMLMHSITLGPYEFYLVWRRARDAALLWDTLSPESQEIALRQAHLLWTVRELNGDLLPLLSTAEGAEIVARAFRDETEEMRALNRFVATARRTGVPPR